jgi:cell division protein FtsB
MDRRFFLIPAGAILFILFFTIFGERGLLRIYHLNRELKDVHATIDELKTENSRLRREVEALRSDRRYLESIARRDFGMVRKNETIYQFPLSQGGYSSHPARPVGGGPKPPAAGPVPASPSRTP